jgi:hypothetical protein
VFKVSKVSLIAAELCPKRLGCPRGVYGGLWEAQCGRCRINVCQRWLKWARGLSEMAEGHPRWVNCAQDGL